MSHSAFRGNTLQCTVTLTAMDMRQGSAGKQDVFRSAEVILGRDQYSEPIIQAHLGKVTKRYSLEGLTLHRRFVKEGKCTLGLSKEKVHLLISNCPPDQLIAFIRTLIGKLASHKVKPTKKTTARERLLNLNSEPPFTEISPLCENDVECVKATLPTTTPTGSKSIKRKIDAVTSDDKENSCQLGKKLVRRSISLSNILTELTPQQSKVLNAIASGKNVFFTGSAGTGKSFLLKRALGSLAPEHTFATASTGIAASHISGMTLHSFAGMGSGKASLDKCIELASRSVVAAQWRKCRHLIIDEISMVHPEYFSKLEAVARVVRKCQEPFGGIQLIVCGDFFQLPPVDKSADKSSDESKNTKKFVFQTNAWRRCIHTVIQLKEVKRQTESTFIEVLHQIRRGYCNSSASRILKSTARNKLDINGLQATVLSTHNDDVDTINDLSLAKLSGPNKVFTAVDNDPALSKHLNELSPVQKEITLKIGAQVMLCKNINAKEGMVNGTRGVVVGFEKTNEGFPIIKTLDGKNKTIKPEKFSFKWSGGITLIRSQLPLKLAWAVSIHKSQGMTLDLVEMSLSRVFEYGQAYVALSRARSLQGLRVLDFTTDCVKAHPLVREYYETLDDE